ncbi:MAG: dihydroneopterin aldolase [Patescibacteria group bacterium]
MVITLRNLIFIGTHGYTEKEKTNPQRFCVTITLESTVTQCPHSDNITDTIDYRDIKNIAQETIEGKHYDLLEPLAEIIADRIVENTYIDSVLVEVSKPDIWKQGIPNISVTKQRLMPRNDLVQLDIGYVLQQLHQVGAVSIPILPVQRRICLLKEADQYNYSPSSDPDSHLVRQDYAIVRSLPSESLFYDLANDFYRQLICNISSTELKTLFPYHLTFNELRLQHYKKDSIGITPHRDGKSKINLVCVFPLKGAAAFGLCDDRSGLNTQILSAPPGNVIIIRGPGFMGSNYQPFHFIRDITEERLTFGLRQIKTPH